MQNIWRYFSIEQPKRCFNCKVCKETPLLKTLQWVPIPHDENSKAFQWSTGSWVSCTPTLQAWCPLYSECGPASLVYQRSHFPKYFHLLTTLAQAVPLLARFSSHSSRSHLSCPEQITGIGYISSLANRNSSLFFLFNYSLWLCVLSIFPTRWKALENRLFLLFSPLCSQCFSVPDSPWWSLNNGPLTEWYLHSSQVRKNITTSELSSVHYVPGTCYIWFCMHRRIHSYKNCLAWVLLCK